MGEVALDQTLNIVSQYPWEIDLQYRVPLGNPSHLLYPFIKNDQLFILLLKPKLRALLKQEKEMILDNLLKKIQILT
jgi:hypothetical protein